MDRLLPAEWVPCAPGYGLDNLSYGVDASGHVLVTLGGAAVDLAALDGLDVGRDVWTAGSLNPFMALGPPAWTRTRAQLQEILGAGAPPQPAAVLAPEQVRPVLPFAVADYVDFYSSEEHATAMGRLLRPGTEPLPPAWRHLPIGYHGRAGTVVVSGSTVPRPRGLVAAEGGGAVLSPSRRLDVEVELGFVVGMPSERGQAVGADRAGEHVFGVVVVNDWSARDVQAFEYQPLGPFLGKSFATSISPWVVPLAALAPYATTGPVQSPPPAAHLRSGEPRNLAVTLELDLNGTVVSTTSAAGLYWSMAQQLAHMTTNGASLRTGDLYATGTISGPGPGQEGSLMEATAAGTRPLTLAGGQRRYWLEDGDTATIRAWCGDRTGPHLRLGEVTGTVVPAAVPPAQAGPPREEQR